jgi:hypothetical protein
MSQRAPSTIIKKKKENKIMLFTGKWMELEIIMLSRVSQVQKDKGYMFSLICGR